MEHRTITSPISAIYSNGLKIALMALSDDSQISYCVCTKAYAEVPRTEFEIWQL